MSLGAPAQGRPYGRRYANNVAITVSFNRPPNTPTILKLDLSSCTGAV